MINYRWLFNAETFASFSDDRIGYDFGLHKLFAIGLSLNFDSRILLKTELERSACMLWKIGVWIVLAILRCELLAGA